jgi:SAM-dependent methyltransferase
VRSLAIPQEAFPYLVAQRGALDDMRGDPGVWCTKYLDVIEAEMRLIEPYLPKRCASILDVGSGMGGIDALINEHYGGACHVTLLDGIDDSPTVELHRKTFNDMSIAARFLHANGVETMDWIDANDAHRSTSRHYDLVVSFKSWCFHVEPARYLDLVHAGCIPGQTVLIIDVRRDKPAWLWELGTAFKLERQIFAGPKTITNEYRAR